MGVTNAFEPKAVRGLGLADDDELAALIEATAAGDRAAFRALYDRSAPRLLAAAGRVLGRRDLAEEAVQEAYISIWEKASTYKREAGAPLAWMSTIARRRAIDRLRASPWLKREAPDEDIERAFDKLAERNDVDSIALKECLDELESKPRDAILSAYIFGMTHSELARARSMPLGTVKTVIRRGILQLRRCLEE